ncbi:MAG: hypothetical protein JWQ87_3623 [Candidatus Sulfotelmatobacter sp.]|nr:hypothetical protein [Candidatus Sulfotelmatobacter sp.]
MKRNLIGILPLVVMSLMLNATGAYAQSVVKADVPFAFRVGSAQLPAGTYKISATSDNAIAIGNGRTTALSSVRRESPRNTGSKLVFHHLGSQYFLAEIWRGADSTGMVIGRSKMEKQLEKELQLASGRSKVGEDVLIALR